MGKLQRFNDRIVIRMIPEELLMERFGVSMNVYFTMGELIRKFAEWKANSLGATLPSGTCVTTFDPTSGEYVVTFTITKGI